VLDGVCIGASLQIRLIKACGGGDAARRYRYCSNLFIFEEKTRFLTFLLSSENILLKLNIKKKFRFRWYGNRSSCSRAI